MKKLPEKVNGRYPRGKAPAHIKKAKKQTQMNVRLSHLEYAVIETAAAIISETKSDFIIRRAYKDAVKILQRRGYKISEKHPVFRGIEKEFMPGRNYTSLTPVDSLDLIKIDIFSKKLTTPDPQFESSENVPGGHSDMRKPGSLVDPFAFD